MGQPPLRQNRQHMAPPALLPLLQDTRSPAQIAARARLLRQLQQVEAQTDLRRDGVRQAQQVDAEAEARLRQQVDAQARQIQQVVAQARSRLQQGRTPTPSPRRTSRGRIGSTPVIAPPALPAKKADSKEVDSLTGNASNQ